MENAEVTKYGVLDMQVCVPKGWSDTQVKEFADKTNECGTENGWYIRKKGNEALAGDPERNPCTKREGFVHIMLEA